jgi:glycosyltransferase involved in cell wall biosynthesis
LLIAGPGWQSKYGIKLSRRINKDEILSKTVTILEQQEQNLIQYLLNSSKASVLWSKHENFAQAISESLSVGTPVLVSKGINIFKEIENNRAGFVENSDWEGAFHAIKKLYELNDSEYNNYSNNAIELFQMNFHPSLYAIRLRQYFELSLGIKP